VRDVGAPLATSARHTRQRQDARSYWRSTARHRLLPGAAGSPRLGAAGAGECTWKCLCPGLLAETHRRAIRPLRPVSRRRLTTSHQRMRRRHPESEVGGDCTWG
jgi:hypothetical protein